MASSAARVLAVTHSPSAQPPKLLDRVRAAIRARHYSIRTEEAYMGWIRRFILFHKKRHPAEMGEREINEFLTHLAVLRLLLRFAEYIDTPVAFPPSLLGLSMSHIFCAGHRGCLKALRRASFRP